MPVAESTSCQAHLERVGVIVPAYRLGLCKPCFRGCAINPRKESLGTRERSIHDVPRYCAEPHSDQTSIQHKEERVNSEDKPNGADRSEHESVAAGVNTPDQRKCAVAECGELLNAQNKSGFCHRHFHRSRAKKIRTNGHTGLRVDRVKANGHSQATSPVPVREISEDRVNSIILSWPLDQKLKVLQAWLTAAI